MAYGGSSRGSDKAPPGYGDWSSLKENLLTAVLDCCQFPVFVVTSRAYLLHSNCWGRQLIDKGSCVKVGGGRLTATNSTDTTRIHGLIDHVTNLLGLPPAPHASCLLSGEQCGRYCMIAFPLSHPAIATKVQDDAAALLVVFSLQRREMPIPHGLLAELFKLTDAEERVARQIAAGQSPNEIARALSLSLPTVRTHLSHIYQKTETTMQPRLTRLLNMLAIFRPPGETKSTT